MGMLCAILFVALAGSGCYFTQSAAVPMPTVLWSHHGSAPAQGLAVLLPGFGDAPADFQSAGIVDLIRARTQFDAVGANAHYGYYRARTILTRLSADVIAPARKQGYRNFVLVGVSMGGMGALQQRG